MVGVNQHEYFNAVTSHNPVDHGTVFTWRGKTAEIEFLINAGGEIIQVEVKSSLNTKAKSMKIYREKYHPARAVLLSGQGANQLDDGLLHAPLYLAGSTGASSSTIG